MGKICINLKTFNLALENIKNNKILLKYFNDIYNIRVKNIEIDCIKSLLLNLDLSSKFLECFYIGYTIPKISKEFDLIRIGSKNIINIELKSSSTEKRILKQLLQNEYYLSFLGRKSFLYSYIKNTNTLYKLKDNKIIKIDFNELKDKLVENYNCLNIPSIDYLFNPSNYLVSPFNSTDKFIRNRYFLTDHQEYIKKMIIRDILYKDFNYFYIEGSSGTGKTLLVYDMARTLTTMGKSSAIVHVGQLNKGQEILINMGWSIFKITELESILNAGYKILFFDEAQRLEKSQVDMIMNISNFEKINCIFAMDPKLKMGRLKQEEEDIVSYILDYIKKINPDFREGILTTNIRTNNEIEEFIKSLFNKRKTPKENIDFKNIVINYFDDINDLKDFCNYLKENKNCTPISYSIYSDDDPLSGLNIDSVFSAHSIIGQEFDNVFLNIDENFKYGKNGNLIYSKEGKQPHFDPIQMAYQMGTRARNKIYLNILNNLEIYKISLEIISRKQI